MQSEKRFGKNSMLNLVSNLGDGLGNWLVFVKFSLQDYLSIYFIQSVTTNNHSDVLREPLNIPHYYSRAVKDSFFPNVINKWNKLDEKIKGATSFSLFTGL